MSAYFVELKKEDDGRSRKLMTAVTSRAEYLAYRNTSEQQIIVQKVRAGNTDDKKRLVQMNYSCLPADEEGHLAGSTHASNTIGMDVDFDPAAPDYEQKMAAVPDIVLAKKEELGLLMLERSATKGFHIVFRRRFTDGLADGRVLENQERNLRWASDLLGVNYDAAAKDITRVFFATTASGEDLLFLDDELFEASPVVLPEREEADTPAIETLADSSEASSPSPKAGGWEGAYLGIPYASIINKWWELYNDGQTPVKSNRNVLTFELAVNLRHICGFDREVLTQVIPAYDGFSETEKMACIDSALSSKMTQMPRRLRDVLTALKKDNVENDAILTAIEEAEQEDDLYYYHRFKKGAFALGIKQSIQACGPAMTMPVLAVTCPIVGALASEVMVEIHGKPVHLNLHSFVVGDAASGKGSLDDVVETWMVEWIALNELYFKQEEEYRVKKKAAKNKKEQPEEPHLPVRFLTMNNTVANLANRLANCDGRHAFSFTPEADTVATKWHSTMSDFSTMLRQAYDGVRYDREAKSVDATTVHIEKLLWNVSMCGTPDALYRVLSNSTDGLLSRFVIAHTPDNTFAPLDEKPCLMTDGLRDKIAQVAHLLPMMKGTLRLPKLEARSREWVERVRREALKDDDRVRARARLRDHTTAVRMTACLILCAVAERLIKLYGLAGAEKELKANPSLTAEMAAKLQRPAMLDAYEVIAESLIDNDMLYFREKLELATSGVSSTGSRVMRGKNDRIFDRLPDEFSFEQAKGAKGGGCTHNSVRQMLKNWRKQQLIVPLDNGHYRKVQSNAK